MSNSQQTKRYIVTFHNQQITPVTVSGILNTNTVEDGAALMATDTFISNEVLLYTQLGIGTALLSETQADQLQLHNDVMAVEEDIEVRALGFADAAVVTNNNGYASAATDASMYNAGYQQAMTDLQQRIAALLSPTTRASQPLVAPQQQLPQHITQVKAPQAWARGITGRGIKVAVIDTGIASHVDLTVQGGVCMVPGVTSFADDNGHGTHCAGIVAGRRNADGTAAGVAPDAALYAVKVLDSRGRGDLSWILAGMEWALRNNIQVVSMSLGSDSAPLTAYREALRRLANAGVSVVCASGNSFNDFGQPFPWVGAPANCHPSVIAVGAVDANGIIAGFSSRGSRGANWNGVSLVAPGVSINSTIHAPANKYQKMSGTSMACPHVSGAVALIKQAFPAFTVSQIKAKLLKTARDLGVAGPDDTYGAGLLDCNAATL
jgi:subtilisin